MLIRLVGHFIENPGRIDKLICIRGLPEEWFFRPSRFGGKELIKPWEPEVEANIPRDCKDLCDAVEITQVFAPVEKGRDYIVDKRIILGVRFDYVTEQGQTMWDQIERYLERTVPRDKMVPKPVLVAPDHKSAYSPHEARRTVRGSLELRPVDGIPVIDLRPQITETGPAIPVLPAVIATPVIMPTVKSPTPTTWQCKQCPKTFLKKQALKMHVMRGHAKKEAVGV